MGHPRQQHQRQRLGQRAQWAEFARPGCASPGLRQRRLAALQSAWHTAQQLVGSHLKAKSNSSLTLPSTRPYARSHLPPLSAAHMQDTISICTYLAPCHACICRSPLQLFGFSSRLGTTNTHAPLATVQPPTRSIHGTILALRRVPEGLARSRRL